MFFEATPYVAAVWAEVARRAEVAPSASPAGASVEGRLTPCRDVDGGLVGNLGDSGAIGSRAPLHGITRGCTNG